MDRTGDASLQAAAQLYRLAQAESLLRRFREQHGREPASADEVGAWALARPELHQVEPSEADHAAAYLTHPELVRRAHGAN